MQLDLDNLRRHYASLNDDALLKINRDELVSQAQECYDAELRRRGLRQRFRSPDHEVHDDETADDIADDVLNDEGGDPEWLGEDAICAVSFIVYPGGDAAAQLDAARHVLQQAGVPCHATLRPPEPPRTEVPRPVYELMVPGALNLKAASILDRDLYNPQTEEEWRGHFAALSDEEFQRLQLPELTAGLLDRIERLTNAYNQERKQRKM